MAPMKSEKVLPIIALDPSMMSYLSRRLSTYWLVFAVFEDVWWDIELGGVHRLDGFGQVFELRHLGNLVLETQRVVDELAPVRVGPVVDGLQVLLDVLLVVEEAARLGERRRTWRTCRPALPYPASSRSCPRTQTQSH